MGIEKWFLIGRIFKAIIFSWDYIIETFNKYINRIKWLWIYYIRKNKKRNYIIDTRVSKNIIYCDGHFVIVNEYDIFMLDDGDFVMSKGFTTDNETYTDFKNFTDKSCCIKNRFNSYIAKVEPLHKKIDGNLQITNMNKEKDNLSFDIELDGRSRFETFSFGLYMAIPNEFKNRIKLDDTIQINENVYGKFTLELKIDKDSPLVTYFAPTIKKDGAYLKPKISEDLFYINRVWWLNKYSKTNGVIKITHKKGE